MFFYLLGCSTARIKRRVHPATVECDNPFAATLIESGRGARIKRRVHSGHG